MKTGISLQQLAAKIEGNCALKHDLVAPASSMKIVADTDSVISLEVADQGRFPILPTAHDQIASRLQIPGKYYNRMLAEAPALLVDNANTWLARADERRMVRTLGGDARGFLSDRYQRIDNEEIAQTVLPILAELPEVKIVSCEITERRMYITAVTPRIAGDVKVGDTVQAGVTISNSEIGFGAVSVRPMIYRLACLNGLALPDSKFTARHVGRQIQEGEDLNSIFSDETRAADDRAVLLKVRDVVRAAVDEATFRKRIEQLAEFAGAKVTGDPSKSIEILSKKIGATEAEQGGILRSLIEGGDLSAWGLINAVTHQAHTATTYDRSMEFTEAGGRLVNLGRGEWREILQAA